MKTERMYFRTGTILFALNILASGLNYLCQLVMAQVLSVESYGTVNTIFSFMMIVAVPGTTLTMVVAKYYASDSLLFGKRLYLKKQLHIVLGLTSCVSLLLFCFQKVFSGLLSIDDLFVLMLAFLLAAFGYFQPLYSGVFSGNRRFVLVGIYSMCIPVYKLVSVGVAYVCSEDDKARLYTVLLFMFLGLIATAAYGYIKSCAIVGEDNEVVQGKANIYSREDFNTFFLNISLMLFMNMDLLSVRYYESDKESGLYSAVLLFGRIIYYFATTLGTILLPAVADSKMTNKTRVRTFNRALFLMLVFALLSMIPINLFKQFFIQLLYGQAYINGSKYMLYVTAISISLSVYTIMVNYVVGVGRTKTPAMIMFVVDIILLLSVVIFDSILNILFSISIVGAVGAIAIYISEMRSVNLDNDL